MSNGTNDFFLKKIIKLDRTVVAQTAEIKELRDEIDGLRADLNAADGRLADARLGFIEDREELLDRIRQLSPERQFKIVFRGIGTWRGLELKPTSISSSNGVTTITVERAE